MKSNRSLQVTRRKLCGCFLAAVGGVAGCQDRSSGRSSPSARPSPDPDTPTQRPTETTTPQAEGEDATKTSLPTSTTEEVNKTTSTAEELNETTYSAAWPFRPKGPIGTTYGEPLSGSPAAVALCSSQDWEAFAQRVQAEIGESLADYSFAQNTDFANQCLIACQARMSSYGSRLQLHSVGTVGGDGPLLTIREIRTDAANAAPTRIILVRIQSSSSSVLGEPVKFETVGEDTLVQVTALDSQ